MTNIPFRFYFSLRSPYVWVALERLMRDCIDSDPIPVVAFPDGIEFNDPAANAARLAYLIEDVARLVAPYGLSLAPPTEGVNWGKVHRTFEFAKRAGKGMAFAHAAARARWTASANLGHEEVIATLASQVGIDPGGAVAALTDESLYAELLDAYMPLLEKDQVFGVPFFAFDAGGKTHRYWGQDRIDMMLADAADAGVAAEPGA